MPSGNSHVADSLGNPLTLDDDASLPLVDDFVMSFISTEARAVNLLALAEADASPIVQAYCATLHLFAESREAAANARPFLTKARTGAARTTPREQRYIAAIEAWADGDIARAIALHAEQAREYPRDLVSVKLGQYHCFNTGDCPGMLRLALAVLPATADVPYVHGMTAFGYEQCHLMREAEASARRAISMCRKEPWAHHALAHVMLTEGRLAEGLAFMESVSDTWTGLNSFMVTHNWWHVALFLIDLGRDAEALAVYDEHAWGVVKDYSQDQIGAVSLLARLESWQASMSVRAGTMWRATCCSGRPTMCCPSWICSTSTGLRAPDGPRPTCCCATLRPLHPGRRLRRAPHGSACACRPRTGSWPMHAATSPRPSKDWASPCRA